MKKLTLLPIFVLIALLLSSCNVFFPLDPGSEITESRPVSEFHEVRFTAAGELFIIQGDTESLVIEAGKIIMPHITTEVNNGVLVIGLDNNRWSSSISRPITFTLTVKDLDGISLSGAGNIESGEIKSTDMVISLSGAGNISVSNLQADSVNSSLTGAGNISLTGAAPLQKVLLTGLGNYQADDLESNDVIVQVTGAGSATVWAVDSLDVEITGAGSVSYYGSPQVSQDVSGLGSVRSQGDK
jgi:hypothetical protein